jgi:hypothetical protein
MALVICIALAVIALVVMFRRIGATRPRAIEKTPVAHVFSSRELQELDAHLDQIAVEEQRRLDASVERYVAGEAGHIVVISDFRYGVALELSDGRRIALGGISRVERRILVRRADQDKLRPTRVARDGFSYRLLLRGETGAEVEIYTRRVALAP